MFTAYIRTNSSWKIVEISFSIKRILAEDLVGQSIIEAFHFEERQTDERGVSAIRLTAERRKLTFSGVVVRVNDDQFLFLLSPEVKCIESALQQGLRVDDFGEFFVGGELLIQKKLNKIVSMEAADYARNLSDTKRELALALENVELVTNFLAHDISNLLSLIIFSAERLPRLATGPDFLAICQTIASAARAGVQFSGTLAGIRSPDEVSVIDLKEWFNKNSAIFQAALRDNVSFSWEMEEQKLMIDVNPAGLMISILNLLTNACESMPGGGSVSIRVGIFKGQGREPYVEICVEDNGPGMPDTGYLDGHSTRTSTHNKRGFGLRSVSRFCQSHGGEMRISSKAGEGAQISLVFPLVLSDDRDLDQTSRRGP